ncbi:hypothetical protein Slin15195_G054650 [Septoria linicola]|uniref:Uncharacterized protein n=1 Tax=Septoria linicola TaxID=215465 RepID=A0A9Q9AUH4_9PEZI|nr:hypothetical protein Slin14017_G125470 [Septoria linicola]USW52146.1 hypothetical protein Slin15195_G054650 [Septoria linicola]
MALSSTSDSEAQLTTAGPQLLVDWSWRKFKSRVTDPKTGKDVYIMDFNFTSPDIEYFHADETSTASNIVKGSRFGTGNIHFFKIDAECVVNGQDIKLKPLKKFTTHYTQLSHAYPRKDGSNEPTTLEWTTTSSFTNWDFICLDQQTQEPIARFSSNIWAVKKVGSIDFMGNPSQELKEELVVAGVTLFYCMLSRSQNIFAFFGAIFADTGPIGAEEAGRERTIEMAKMKQADADRKAKVS